MISCFRNKEIEEKFLFPSPSKSTCLVSVAKRTLIFTLVAKAEASYCFFFLSYVLLNKLINLCVPWYPHLQ